MTRSSQTISVAHTRITAPADYATAPWPSTESLDIAAPIAPLRTRYRTDNVRDRGFFHVELASVRLYRNATIEIFVCMDMCSPSNQPNNERASHMQDMVHRAKVILRHAPTPHGASWQVYPAVLSAGA
jgi:hypothetical protein